MIHFTCMECQMGFQARSYDEALEEQEGAKKAGEYDPESELVYAKYCPYCGSQAIEER